MAVDVILQTGNIQNLEKINHFLLQYHFMRKILLILLLALLIPGCMAYPQNFTPVFDPIADSVHYNQTYTRDQTGYTPLWVFLTFAVITVSLLVIAYRFRDEMAGMLAIIFSIVSALASRSVDVVTGYGATSGNSYVMLEQHVIYNFDMLTMIFAICFILSILNLYYIYLTSKTEGVNNGINIDRKRF